MITLHCPRCTTVMTLSMKLENGARFYCPPCDKHWDITWVVNVDSLDALRALVHAMRAFDGTNVRRKRLQYALTNYEATGDHNHDGKSLAIGEACDGGDCWVARARETLLRTKE